MKQGQSDSHEANDGISMRKARTSRILETLRELQYGSGHPILLLTQDPTGLGAQISRRLMGLRLAYLNKRKVVFPYLTEPPYGQVFEPLHSSANYAELMHDAVDYFSPNAAKAKIIKLDFLDLANHRQVQNRIFNYSLAEDYDSPQFDLDRHLYDDGFLLSFCRLTDENRQIIAEAARRISVGQDTLGVHVRRGDKTTETPYVPIAVINDNIAKLCAEKGFRRVFVSSDNPDVFGEIKLPRDVTLVFDETEKRYNNANHRFLMKNPELSRQETQTAVKNIFLLGSCGAIVGQSNAHFAGLAGAMIAYRGDGNYGKLIEGDYILRRSNATRLYYSAKLRLRAVVRTIFPWVSLRHARRRISG